MSKKREAIADVCGDRPVTAFSSYFGTVGAGCGLLELMAGVLAGEKQTVLPTLGYSRPDEACPIQVATKVAGMTSEYMLKLSFTPFGHAAAVVSAVQQLDFLRLNC